jgi:hypothetical protein
LKRRENVATTFQEFAVDIVEGASEIRMRQFGKVEIPQAAFIAALKVDV